MLESCVSSTVFDEKLLKSCVFGTMEAFAFVKKLLKDKETSTFHQNCRLKNLPSTQAILKPSFEFKAFDFLRNPFNSSRFFFSVSIFIFQYKFSISKHEHPRHQSEQSLSTSLFHRSLTKTCLPFILTRTETKWSSST